MVSHAASHQIITTGINNKYNLRGTFGFHKILSKIPCDIFFLVHVIHHVSLGTCTQCVPVVLLANRDQFLDRSDRASNTSFVCWLSNVRFYLCKIRIYFLQFQNLPSLYASQEAPFTVSSHLVISKPSRFVGYNELDPLLCRDIWTTNNVFSARGW